MAVVKGYVCNIFVIHKYIAIFSLLVSIYWGRRCYGKTKCVAGILSGGCTSVTGTGDKNLPGICVLWRFVGSSVQCRNVPALLYFVPTSKWVVEALINSFICRKQHSHRIMTSKCYYSPEFLFCPDNLYHTMIMTTTTPTTSPPPTTTAMATTTTSDLMAIYVMYVMFGEQKCIVGNSWIR